MRPSLLLGRRTSGVGIWSGVGSVHQMDISSNTQKVHGRVLRANPVTISHFLYVPHYYWGVGRPEWVSGTTPTTAPCSPSGWQCYLYVGSRTTLAQSPNQCQIDWWLDNTFLLSCYLNTQFLMKITQRGPFSSVFWLCNSSNPNHRLNHTNYTSPVYIYMGLFSVFQSHTLQLLQYKWVLNMPYIH